MTFYRLTISFWPISHFLTLFTDFLIARNQTSFWVVFDDKKISLVGRGATNTTIPRRCLAMRRYYRGHSSYQELWRRSGRPIADRIVPKCAALRPLYREHLSNLQLWRRSGRPAAGRIGPKLLSTAALLRDAFVLPTARAWKWSACSRSNRSEAVKHRGLITGRVRTTYSSGVEVVGLQQVESVLRVEHLGVFTVFLPTALAKKWSAWSRSCRLSSRNSPKVLSTSALRGARAIACWYSLPASRGSVQSKQRNKLQLYSIPAKGRAPGLCISDPHSFSLLDPDGEGKNWKVITEKMQGNF